MHANSHQQRVRNELYFARKQKFIYCSVLVISVMLLALNTLQNVDRRFLRKNDRRWDVYSSGFQIADIAFRSLKAVIDIYMFVNFMAIFLFFKRAREARMKLAGR